MKYFIRRNAKVEIEIHEEVKYIDLSENFTRVQYSDVVAFEVIHGEAAELIEAESDGSCIDEYHEYLVLHFANGETATFRNSHVDMFVI